MKLRLLFTSESEPKHAYICDTFHTAIVGGGALHDDKARLDVGA